MIWTFFAITTVDAAPRNAARIPAGQFQMGSGRGSDESPRHAVSLSAFLIDREEVSIGEFERFVNQGWNDDKNWSSEGLKWRKQRPKGAGSKIRAAGRDANHPVVGVSFYEAEAYCKWVGGQLPSEAQWERAACPEEGRFPWGESEDVEAAWYSGGKYGHLQSVLTKPTNQAPPRQRTPEGLFHTVGNVWEWTSDWYHKDSYRKERETDPKGVESGIWKTMRGGSFMNLPSYCTCTHREPARPERVAFTVGFRCAYAP